MVWAPRLSAAVEKETQLLICSLHASFPMGLVYGKGRPCLAGWTRSPHHLIASSPHHLIIG